MEIAITKITDTTDTNTQMTPRPPTELRGRVEGDSKTEAMGADKGVWRGGTVEESGWGDAETGGNVFGVTCPGTEVEAGVEEVAVGNLCGFVTGRGCIICGVQLIITNIEAASTTPRYLQGSIDFLIISHPMEGGVSRDRFPAV